MRRTRDVVCRSGLPIAFALVLLANGCAGQPSEEHSSVQDPTQGGTLRMVQEAPRSLDPLASDSVYESIPLNQIFDTLVTFDPSLNIVPSLAGTWTIAKDGRSYTFHLRDDVRFHDGSPFDASDVVFSVKRLLVEGQGSLAFPYMMVVEGAQADEAPFTGGAVALVLERDPTLLCPGEDCGVDEVKLAFVLEARDAQD